MAVISMCCLLYMALWSSYLYFNAKVTDEDGDEVPFHEALGHFFSSPWWLDVKQSFIDVWQFAQEHGWMETWRQIVSLSDPSGEQNAFKVRRPRDNSGYSAILLILRFIMSSVNCDFELWKVHCLNRLVLVKKFLSRRVFTTSIVQYVL